RSYSHCCPRTREEVLLGNLGVHDRSYEMVVLGRPGLGHDLVGQSEPETVRIHLGGVCLECLVREVEVLTAMHAGGDLPAWALPLPDPLHPVGEGVLHATRGQEHVQGLETLRRKGRSEEHTSELQSR